MGAKKQNQLLHVASGFKSVLKVNATCICEAIKSSAQLGIELNITRAANLHSACKVSASPLSKCGIISHYHTGTPAVHNPPKSSPKTAPSPKSGASSVPTPSPANAHGGAYSISASFLVFTSMLVIYFSCVSNLF
ncbi:Non-specific lipid-transfer protein-like protein [Quillaja saponaria]|uniref:Non-specific lipid-transfer protein-like protein n=1 Tax=Quillaja saponaria TaxID=32244 RepID=A0AAD7LWM2_QUISA|nr:Non-specific lipid-transfer protein-like protein [Quillaja saponaria]